MPRATTAACATCLPSSATLAAARTRSGARPRAAAVERCSAVCTDCRPSNLGACTSVASLCATLFDAHTMHDRRAAQAVPAAAGAAGGRGRRALAAAGAAGAAAQAGRARRDLEADARPGRVRLAGRLRARGRARAPDQARVAPGPRAPAVAAVGLERGAAAAAAPAWKPGRRRGIWCCEARLTGWQPGGSMGPVPLHLAAYEALSLAGGGSALRRAKGVCWRGAACRYSDWG